MVATLALVVVAVAVHAVVADAASFADAVLEAVAHAAAATKKPVPLLSSDD